MIDFWATLGWACAYQDLHEEIFSLTDPTKSFQDLDQLSATLVGYGLRLSRWEVMSLNRIFSQRWDPDTQRKVYFRKAADDETLIGMRNAWNGYQSATSSRPAKAAKKSRSRQSSSTRPGAPQGAAVRTEYSVECYAVFGLACIDTQFRDAMHDTCKKYPDKLKGFLTTGSPISPPFHPESTEFKVLKDVMLGNGDQMHYEMDYFETTRWVQPTVHAIFGGCDAGYSRKPFFYVSQQDLALFLQGNPDLKELLFNVGVIK
jgi:hypothetical protein